MFMFDVSLISASIVVLLALLQLCVALYFYLRYGVIDKNSGHSNWQPPATVVLAIRGNDPSLRATIMGLLGQEYAHYELILVVDHHTDDSWTVVNEIKRQHDCDNRIRILELKQPHAQCGLKCSALAQAVSEISDRTEVLVLIDADVVPHARWLNAVVAPLEDETIGVVTGNHWSEPTRRNIASLVRSAWNAGALVPTAILANPWAGTCAMRMSDIHQTGLVDIWKRSIVDDGPIRSAFKLTNKTIKFVPGLIMLNRESCTGNYVIRYITRMLTWSRIYESTFSLTAFHMFVTVGSVLGLFGLTVYLLAMGSWVPASISFAGLALNSLLMATAYMLTRETVARQSATREDPLQPLSIAKFLQIACLIPITQLTYGICTIGALTKRSIQWRKITYQLSRKGDVKMLEYSPLSNESRKPQEVSI